MKHVLLILALIFISSCAYSQQVEDWIYFKDSTLVKGLVTEIKEGGIEVETAEGLQKYRLHTVARIVKQNPELMERKDNNQTQRGTFKISGMFSFSYLNFDASYYYVVNYREVIKRVDYSYSLFQFNPSFMYFFMDNFGGGLTVSVDGYSRKDPHETDQQIKSGLALEYYFLSGSIRPFASLKALYTISEDKGGYEYAAGAGLSFALAKNVALQPLIQYGRGSYADSKPQDVFFYSVGLAYFLY